MTGQLDRFLGIADDPSDDDDLRLRKRIGVAAGYITIVSPLGVPLSGVGGWPGVTAAVALSAISLVNLAVLARVHRFEAYVTVGLLAGLAFTVFVDLALGGIAASGAGIVWAFLAPAVAILALGPRRATVWFVLFVVALLVVVLADPIVRNSVGPPPYGLELIFYAANIGVPAGIIFVLLRFTDLRRREAQVRSDELLTNAIPISIAARLRHGERRIAEAYPETTVLFSDIVGFTPWAQRTDPARVVGLLDALFSRFDELAGECGVEKIKTIGDAYMAVAGAPEPRPDHAAVALAMATAMLGAVADWSAANALGLEVRIGLASGGVVGGVIGQRRILFDL